MGGVKYAVHANDGFQEEGSFIVSCLMVVVCGITTLVLIITGQWLLCYGRCLKQMNYF